MVPALSRPRVALPLKPVLAAAAALVAGTAVAVTPLALLEQAAVSSGIAAVVGAAEPPLGFTARVTLILATTVLTFGLGWLALGVALGARRLELNSAMIVTDADGREPMRANRDLGTPFLEVQAARPPAPPRPDPESIIAAIRARNGNPAEQPLPLDLDQPLAAFDPGALPIAPVQPAPLVAPLARPSRMAEGERLEVVQLRTPPVLRASERVAGPAQEASIQALLERLERSMLAQVPAEPAPFAPAAEAEDEAVPGSIPWIEDTLGELRALAGRR